MLPRRDGKPGDIEPTGIEVVRRVPGRPAFRDAEKERGVPLPSEQPEIEEAHAHSPRIADTDLVRTFVSGIRSTRIPGGPNSCTLPTSTRLM